MPYEPTAPPTTKKGAAIARQTARRWPRDRRGPNCTLPYSGVAATLVKVSPPLFIVRDPLSCQVSVARVGLALKVFAIDQALDPLLQVWRRDGEFELLEQL